MALVKKVEIDIGVRGDTASKAKLDEISRRAEELKKAFPEFKLKIDKAAASEKLRLFRAELAETVRDRTVNVKVRVDDSGLLQFARKMKGGGGPGWLGPALALAPAAWTLGGVTAGAAIGLGGAAVAGGGALAAFGAVAKPVLADTLKAEQQVQAAQQAYSLTVTKIHAQYQYSMLLAKTQAQRNAAYAAEQKALSNAQLTQQLAVNKAYAQMSPQQIALSKELGDMANAWQNLKAAQTPVIAGALQPWLHSVTDLTGKLAPIIARVSPVIKDLGTQFNWLVNSKGFAGFVNFIGGTGSAAVGAIGSTLIDFINAAILLLPKFNPLIEKTVGWIADLGPSVLAWASSKKTADDITKFMGWFSKNGPLIGGLLKNIGGALKALAPGLGPASATELNIISQFFAFIAKLPPSIAKPLLEVAGVMLTLNKLGVVSVGVKLLGPGAGAAAGEAAAGGAAAGLWGKLLPGVRLAGGALAAVVVVDMVLKNTSSGPGGKNWWDNPFGLGTSKDPKSGKTTGTPSGLTSWKQLGTDIVNWWNITWNNTITRTAKGFHDLAGWFDRGRHDVAGIWNLTWHDTIGRLNNGINQAGRLFGGWEHDIAHWFDTARHDIAAAWDLIWAGTVSRVSRGIADVTGWFKTLPGKIRGAFFGLGADLWGIGKRILGDMLTGLKQAAGPVVSWLGGFAHGVVGIFKKIWGWFSPSSVMFEGGRSLMEGLAAGIRAHAGKVQAAAGGVGGNVVSWLTQAIHDTGVPMSWMPALQRIVQLESGGNPRAVNPIGVMGEHAEGLMQTLPSTFAQFATVAGGIFNPVANAVAAIRYITATYGSPFNIPNLFSGPYQGYAGGTLAAAPGLAWVGERGPELVRFRGGEQVMPGSRAGNTYIINVSVPPTVNPREAGRQVADLILAHTKAGGRLYPQGTAPR
jgi:SLT domain-containing protein